MDQPVWESSRNSSLDESLENPLLDVEASSVKTATAPTAPTATWMGSIRTNVAPPTKWWQNISGGTLCDAFMMEASQQVGQCLLCLPREFAQMGYALGIICLLVISVMSMWTQFNLISLLAEYEHIVAQDKNHPRHGDKNYIASYHDVMWSLCGKVWGRISLFVAFLTLLGLGVAQIVSTASNLYLLSQAVPKRTYSLMTGAVFSLTAFIPNYRDYRLLAFVGICSTFYTAWYITIASVSRGPDEDVEYGAPTNLYGFFQGLTNMIFMFGGHTAVIEKAVKMNNPQLYDRAYYAATIYVYIITVPTGISGYHTFGINAANTGNALYLLDSSPAQKVSAALMVIHEFVAFGLFVGSLYHIWEKILHIEGKAYWLRVLSRFVVVGLVLLIATAMPYFGIINSVLGAFVSTFGSFILPCLIYNLHFNSEEKINQVKRKIWFGWSVRTAKILNWIVVLVMLVFGVGFGGWAGMKALLAHVHEFHLFPECYQC